MEILNRMFQFREYSWKISSGLEMFPSMVHVPAALIPEMELLVFIAQAHSLSEWGGKK